MIIPSKEQFKRLLSEIERSLFLKTVLVFAAFIVTLIILFIIDSGSFEYLWKGRAPYFLFLWLLFLEAIIGWKNLKTQHNTFWNKKTVLSAVILLLPIVYSVGLNFGLNDAIVDLGRAVGVPAEQFGEWYVTHSWLFSFEYVLFAVFFVASIWLLYGVRGLNAFSVSAFFVGILGFYILGIEYFFGNVSHTHHHIVWFSLILAFSRCGDALALDSKGKNYGPSTTYTIPIRIIWILIGILYFFPGFWKIYHSGPEWALHKSGRA